MIRILQTGPYLPKLLSGQQVVGSTWNFACSLRLSLPNPGPNFKSIPFSNPEIWNYGANFGKKGNLGLVCKIRDRWQKIDPTPQKYTLWEVYLQAKFEKKILTRKEVRGGSFCQHFQRSMMSSRVNDVTCDDKIFSEDVNSYFVHTFERFVLCRPPPDAPGVVTRAGAENKLRVQRKRNFDSKTFLSSATNVWNSLPSELRQPKSLLTFESMAKSHFFT